MKRKYSLKNKKRFSIVISTFVFITMITILTSTVYGFKQPQYTMITVRSGDTLWDIAKRYDNDKDIREFIYEIKAANNLKDSQIYQGCILKVPVE